MGEIPKAGTRSHKRVIDHFIRRLNASISRSSLLKVRVSKSGRLLDCSKLTTVRPNLPHELINAVIKSSSVQFDLNLRPQRSLFGDEDNAPQRGFPNSSNSSGQPTLFSIRQHRPLTQGVSSEAESTPRDHSLLYDLFERRMRRHAELAKRETGVHALWLGYPLLYVSAYVEEVHERQFILAPVLLWPVSIECDLEHEGRIKVSRPKEAAPKCNLAMATWVSRQLGLNLLTRTETELLDLDRSSLQQYLDELASQFRECPPIDCDSGIEPIPPTEDVAANENPALYNSAVMGYFRWQNEAILADLEELKNAPEVSGVAGGFASGSVLPQPPQSKPPPEGDRFIVCEADFSQERVIWQARVEPGLVVHGPPGTGKSQTIVNVIADALAHGRTVLMICQKQVATRVVLERLRAVGLDGLCVEVHDSESDRRLVFQTIRDQADTLPQSVSSVDSRRRDEIAREITAVETELDAYSRGLRERQDDIGSCYRDLIARENEALAEFPSVRNVRLLGEPLQAVSWTHLEELRDSICEAGNLFREAAPLGNPWRFRQRTVSSSPSLRQDIVQLSKKLAGLDARHMREIGQIPPDFSLPSDMSEFLRVAQDAKPHLEKLVDPNNRELLVILQQWLCVVQEKSGEARAEFLSCTKDARDLAHTVQMTPHEPRLEVLLSNPGNHKPLGYYASHILRCRSFWARIVQIGPFLDAKANLQRSRYLMPEADIFTFAGSLQNGIRRHEMLQRLSDLCEGLVPNEVLSSSQPPPPRLLARIVHEALQNACWLADAGPKLEWLREALLKAPLGDTEKVAQIMRALEAQIRRAPVALELVKGLQSLKDYFTDQGVSEAVEFVLAGRSLHDWLDGLVRGCQKLDALIAYDATLAHGADELIRLVRRLEQYEADLSRDERLPRPPAGLSDERYGTWWFALAEHAAIQRWKSMCHERFPQLLAMRPDAYDKKRARLREILREKRALEPRVIQATWLQRQIPLRAGQWKRMFQLRRSKYGEAKRLREAVELSIGEGLLTLRPCWLMNPSAVAQVFPLRQGLFDVVIFDEASQCLLEHALPSIYRGKALVVSGDEKQLPPTSFFAAHWDADSERAREGDQEEAVATDQPVEQGRADQLRRLGVEALIQSEDLLRTAVEILPAKYLLVHYRSLHSYLIEFSNRAFYGGRLEIPPSLTVCHEGDRPLVYEKVEGVYDQRTNRLEAGKIVEVLRRLYAGREAPTVGVVTFNQPQRDLIEDLIEEECQRDPVFAARYRHEMSRKESNQDVGFFVKNLENVQGDERDVMIFSTTFGPDTGGTFYRRFGPVGMTGGERRLNVAVTRAKRQVVVVTSMPLHEIASALSAGGSPASSFTPAGYLQLYLAYAKACSENDMSGRKMILNLFSSEGSPQAPAPEPESPLEEEVREVLHGLGWKTDCQVGASGFRIDLAVLHPELPLRYILGIECDGATYHSDRSARSRDLWRQSVLESHGWRIHRVWSTNWWNERDREIDKIGRALDEALRAK